MYLGREQFEDAKRSAVSRHGNRFVCDGIASPLLRVGLKRAAELHGVRPYCVAITGADGFIGRHLCEELEREGFRVARLTRRLPWSIAGERSVARSFVGETLGDDLNGVDVVIHLAAVSAETRTGKNDGHMSKRHREVNVEGTRTVLDACRALGISRLVFISTVKAVGEISARGEVWRDDQEARPTTSYGRSKLEAERLVAEAALDGSFDATVLRLPPVYGPGMHGNVFQVFRWVERGLPVPFKGVDNRRSMAYVGNVVSAIRRSVEMPNVKGTYFVEEGTALSSGDLVRAVAQVLGSRPRVFRPPAWLLRLAPRFGDILPGRLKDRFGSAAFDRLLGSLTVDGGRFRRDFDWAPPFSFDEGLRRTAEWYLSAASQR